MDYFKTINYVVQLKTILLNITQTIKEFPISSKKGFTFSIELLAKAHRKNLKIAELPEKWPVRTSGKSKFKYYTIPYYLPWYLYIFFSGIRK